MTARSIEHSGGSAAYPGRGMGDTRRSGGDRAGFDIVRTGTGNTLCDVRVPHEEMREFMGIINVFRDDVVADEHRDEDWEAP